MMTEQQEGLPAVVEILQQQQKPLFAILDAARDEQILATLLFQSTQAHYQSLFEGLRAQKLMAVSPYLVQLSGQAQVLNTLIERGWGNNWGVYFTGGQAFYQLLEHLRSLTIVTLEDGRKAFFRFYDPRVLRVFLSTCSPQQATEFFGSIECYWMEGKNPQQILQFAYQNGELKSNSIAVELS
ncbi:MAG: DUF4123 domain-containing protein [Pseudomonadota bacterium]|nr:DUF4123 domain-containing protein [Pseudomonadota bacterium]